jgi:hypothetical protein
MLASNDFIPIDTRHRDACEAADGVLLGAA